jgi:hypothetical protein
MSKQTAVEWLLENMPHLGQYIPLGVSIELHAKFQQAKEMEKEQMCQFAFDYQDEFFNNGKVLPIEQYYNQTYGGDK